MKYSGMIDNHTVRSDYPYVVYGSVRGHRSSHRTLSGAIRAADRDRAACAALPGRAYSDVWVYRHDGSGWEIEAEG